MSENRNLLLQQNIRRKKLFYFKYRPQVNGFLSVVFDTDSLELFRRNERKQFTTVRNV
jgi:hypothetical protein